MNSDILRKISLDVSCGRTPNADYTEEMKAAWIRIHDRFEEWLKTHPDAMLVLPDELPD